MKEALAEAKAGLSEGGLPIGTVGSVLVDEAGVIIARGHNMRVQTGDPTAHAEMVAIKNAGRRRDWHRLTLVSTLSPCIMCTGMALLYKIKRVIVGENKNFSSFAEGVMADAKVDINFLQDDECVTMMRDFIQNNEELWNE